MNLSNELYRKSLHFSAILIPLFFYHFGKWKTLLILAPITIFMVTLDHLRQENPKIKAIFLKLFAPILRPHEIEGKKLCGASFMLLAACINFLLFSKEIAVVSFSIVVISDALSAIVGKTIPSQPFFEKSRAGALAFLISALLILVGCGMIFHVHFWFYFFGVFSVFCVTMIEARPSLLHVDDNFSIPMIFSFLMTGFGFMWG